MDNQSLETLNAVQQVLRALMLALAGSCKANLGDLGAVLEAAALNDKLEPVARQMIADLAAGATATHAAGIRKN